MKILLMGISVRALAESAVLSGYTVVALDAFGDQDLRALTESYSLHRDFHCSYSPRELYKASRTLAFDAVAYTSNLENHPKMLTHIQRHGRVIGNPPKVIRSVRNWSALFSRLRAENFPVPETIFGGGQREVENKRRWLVKPLLSGGGHGIEFAPGTQYGSGTTGSISDSHANSEFMLQEFIQGKSCSASFVSNGRRCVVLGIAEQLIGLRRFGSRGFRYCGSILPLAELLNPDVGKKILEQVRQLAAFLTREYGLIGVNGMDFMLKGDRIYLTEINPRYSASMELAEQAYKLPIFDLHTQAVLEETLPSFRLETAAKRKKFYGKAILFAERDTAVPDTRSWQAKGIRDIPESGEKLRKGGPICTILTESPTYNETLADLTDQAGRLKEEIYGKTDLDLDYGTLHAAGYRDLDWKGPHGISGGHERD